MSGGVTILLVGIIIIAAILAAVVALTRQGGKVLNVEKYQARWLAIENSLDKSSIGTYQLAIFEADKLLDLALRERGFAGDTMGERMKSAREQWSNSNHVWGAHKVRNKLAHEANVRLSREIALRALAAYKQGLKDLGAI
jgi:hypothetical protein